MGIEDRREVLAGVQYYLTLITALGLLATSSAIASAPLDNAALKVMIETVASLQGIRTRLVCVILDGKDLTDARRRHIRLSHGRPLLPGSECEYKSPYFVHLHSGESAIRLDFSSLVVTPIRVESSFHAQANDHDCSGALVVVLVDGTWVGQSDDYSCIVR